MRVMTPRTSVRTPVAPAREKGRFAEKIWPVAIVNEVAVPITVPAALTNESVPVHAAAVPVEVDAEAVLTTLSCTVSELASPMGGEVNDRVVVEEVVCACASTPLKHASDVA